MVALPKINTQAVSAEVIERLRNNTPRHMMTHRQWIVWKYQTVDGKLKKPPFTPHNRHAAKTTDATTWGTFDQALARYAQGGYDGIGYVCDGDIVGGDLDDCRDPKTGEIASWAQEIIDQLRRYAYIEVSPSTTGLRFFMLADLPFNYKKHGPFELSYRSCYVTFTGNHVENTQIDLSSGKDIQNSLNEIVEKHFSEDNVNTGGGYGTSVREPQPIYTRSRSDNEVIEKATNAKNGWRFAKLFAGNAQGHKSRSEAHLALCSMLVYWTNSDASQIDAIFRQSGFFNDEATARKWDACHYADGRTYGQATIDKAMETSRDYSLPKPRRQERSIPHVRPAAPRVTIEEHLEKLAKIGNDIQGQIGTHIKGKDGSVLVVAAPPGVGKSRLAASLGASTTQPVGNFNVAWVAQRHDMVDSVEDLQYYRHIQACTEQNCSAHGMHTSLAMKGYNSWSLHSKHTNSTGAKDLCDFACQFFEQGSAVYQQAHIGSAYPAQHEAIILDEIDTSSWLPEREVTLTKLHDTLVQYEPNSPADSFLRMLQGLLTDCAQSHTPLYGKALFDALNEKLHGKLPETLGILDSNAYNRNARPYVELDPNDPEEEGRIQNLAPVLMPHLLRAFMSELVRWQHGQEWNSCLRVGASHGTEYRLYITEPLQFVPDKEGHVPPVVLLDATADEEVHSRLFGRKINIARADIGPAPGTQHIAVRTGKRYGKTSLTTKRKDGKPNRDLQRAIAEVRYQLNKLDPDGEQIRAESVGIISFMGCVDAIGEALNIPEHRRGHYWGIRGSNHLEDCSILLLVGTPTLRPDELLRQARALYRDDPELIKETSPQEYKETGRHTDPRLQHFTQYTANAELTQAAHRSRAIRHENRVVVSFCLGDIDFLPITETINELPYLTPEGEDSYEARRNDEEQRIAKAYEDLTKDGGKQPTQEALRKAAKVRKTAVAEWMRTRTDVPYPPTVFTQENRSSRDAIENIIYSTPGTSESEATENAPPEPGPPENAPPEPQPIPLEAAFWEVGRQYGYPEIADLGLSVGMMGWKSFALTRWYRLPDVIARLGGIPA